MSYTNSEAFASANVSTPKATFTKQEMLDQIHEAFLCGVVAGRSDASGKQDQEDLENYRAEVDTQYEPFWPGELLMAGFYDCLELVSEAEHESYLRKQREAARKPLPVAALGGAQ